LAERLRELAGDDPDLVRLALRDLREHLQVLVGEQLRVGVAGVDRLEDRPDRLGLSLRPEDRRLPLALGAQDRALLLALGLEDLRLLDALGVARLSRSARICFSIDSWIEAGGSIAFSSTRFTRMPHFPVASSRTPRNCWLIWSREVSVSSRSSPPITFRSVVTVSCSIARMKSLIS
jgi:hypothetical protein